MPGLREPSWLFLPSFLTRLVQYGFLAYFCFIGFQFFQYYLWATGQSAVYTVKPASVEAFLPIGALAAAKYLFLTGEFDTVHPAGLTIFLMAILLSLGLRKSFCGYLCPVGVFFRIIERIGKRLKMNIAINKWLSLILTLPKYVFLAGFVFLILLGMDAFTLKSFLNSHYYRIADSKMLLLFLYPSGLFLGAVFFIITVNFFIPSFWCRGFCPYGAFLGLFSSLSPIAVHRDSLSCTQCQCCTKACPSRITIHDKKRISGPECIGCLECVSVCPKENCLTTKVGYGGRLGTLPVWFMAVSTCVLVYFVFAWASVTDHWETSVDKEQILKDHQNIRMVPHP